MAQNVEALRKSESNKALSQTSSLSNLYNSNSQKGSNTTLAMSNSAVFNNGAGFVQKGTIAHIDNISNINPYNSTKNNESNNYQNDKDDDNDSVFELNWKPQVSSDYQTSGYYDKVN